MQLDPFKRADLLDPLSHVDLLWIEALVTRDRAIHRQPIFPSLPAIPMREPTVSPSPLPTFPRIVLIPRHPFEMIRRFVVVFDEGIAGWPETDGSRPHREQDGEDRNLDLNPSEPSPTWPA